MSTNRTIPGRLDMAALGALHDPHRPPHARQLEDALFSTRRALSALRAIEVATLPAAEHQRLSRLASQLADIAEELAP